MDNTNAGTGKPQGTDNNSSASISIKYYPRELKYGMVGQDVKNLQEALVSLKYLKLARTTNVFGNGTRNSVANFQRVSRLKETGIADRVTLDLICTKLNLKPVENIKSANNSKTAASKPADTKTKAKVALIPIKLLQKGMKGTDIINLQNALKYLRYFNDSSNGIFGEVTETAVKNFQKDNGLVVKGIVEYKTIVKLNRMINDYNKA